MKASTQKRILVIENNPDFRKTLKMRLESSGYSTLLAENGLAGLNMVRKENPDLIITDIMLPGLDGHKVCRMIKFDRKLAHIPVIVLTSRDLDQDAELAKQCGADAFILKTTKPPIVMEVIQKLLEEAEPPALSSDIRGES
jgi:two-component system alkaline phosphatase synthesis response regulator PhoP